MNSSKHRLYVGVDVHSRNHKVALMPRGLLDCPGPVWGRAETLDIRNDIADFTRLHTAISRYTNSAKEVVIAVDHTGGHYSEPLVYFLEAKGYAVYYLESKAVKAARDRLLDQENKSDAIDATSTAYLLYLRDEHGLSFRISATSPDLNSKAAALRFLMVQRNQVNKLATQATNRLHQFLLAVFPEGEAQYFNQLLKIASLCPTPKDILVGNSLESVKGISQEDKQNILKLAASTVGVPIEIYGGLIKDLSAQRAEYLAKRDALTLQTKELLASHPYRDILLSFPHLGEIVAATIIGIIKDIDRWSNKKKFKKALGVYGSLTQSGSKRPRTRQGKEGSRHGRRALFQVCLGCIRTNVRDNDFRDYYNRQVAKGKPKMKALVAAMGKLAEIIYHCLKVGEPYQYQGTYR